MIVIRSIRTSTPDSRFPIAIAEVTFLPPLSAVGYGESKYERAALPERGLHIDSAAVGFGHAFDQGQAEAHALHLTGEAAFDLVELLEDFRFLFGRDAGTVVAE